MAVFVLTCPHCQAERMSFDSIDSYMLRNRTEWNVFCICRRCEEGIVICISSSPNEDPHLFPGDPLREFMLLRMHPKRQDSFIPENISSGIKDDFEEAIDSLQRQKWTSAGIMFRKVLQRATSDLCKDDESFKRKRLVQRIDILAERNLITPAMKDWAHAIRLDGNEATHEEDEDFTADKAREMKDFTELFLIYAFTLPARIKASKQKRG